MQSTTPPKAALVASVVAALAACATPAPHPYLTCSSSPATGSEPAAITCVRAVTP